MMPCACMALCVCCTFILHLHKGAGGRGLQEEIGGVLFSKITWNLMWDNETHNKFNFVILFLQ